MESDSVAGPDAVRETPDVVLSTSHLTKTYGNKRAVDDLSMTVRQGDIYGFVGLNGAGKTTVIRLITGLIRKTGGSFALLGKPDSHSLTEERRRISSMVETPALYLNMTGRDNLRMQCGVMGADPNRIPELLKLVGLDGELRKPAKNYSLGMRQRLGIAMALVGDPLFMLLDEPTNGLDPEGIIEVRDLLKTLNRTRGITILISSHILTELERLATTYGFIHNGRLLREISAEDIERNCGRSFVLEANDREKAMAALGSRNTCFCRQDGKIQIDGELGESVTSLLHYLEERGVTVNGFTTVTRDLENYFMELIGGRAK